MRKITFVAYGIFVAFTLSSVALIAYAAPTTCQIANGCTGTSTSPAYGQLLIGGQNGEYELVASSTLINFAPVQSVFGRTGAITAQTGDYTTSQIPEGSNLYYTPTRVYGILSATTSLPNITTLASLSLPYAQLTGTPLIASSTLLSDNNAFSGSDTFTQTLNLIPALNEGIYLQDSTLGVAVATTSGIYLQNTTPATAVLQQVSPFFTLEGQGWGTTAGASNPVDWTNYLLPVTATVPTANLIWASSVSSAAPTTRMTLTSSGTLEPTNLEVSTGSLGSTNTTNGALWIPATITITHEALAQWIYGGSAGVGIRTGFYGSTATTLTAGDSYAAVDVGRAPVTTAATGNHPFLANLAVMPIGFVTQGASTVGNTAALYIDGAATTTVTGNDYDLYASSTAPDYFGGNVGVNIAAPLSLLDIKSSAVGITGGFQLQQNSGTGHPAIIYEISSGEGDLSLFNGASENIKLRANGSSYFDNGNVGVGTSTPVANFQATTASSNATTTVELGKSGQTTGTCLKLYRTDGTAIYAYVLAGATTFTLSTTACASVTGF